MIIVFVGLHKGNCGNGRNVELFGVKLQHVMSYKRLFGQLYQKRDPYTETLTQLLSVNLNTTINTPARLPLK